MTEAYVVDAIRTPVGKYGGALSTVRPDDLLAHLIRSIIRRNTALDPALIEDIIAGAANQAGEDNRNVARMAALLAGLPVSVAGVTVNRLCASGLQSIIDASRAIRCGEGDFFLAGGVESMTRAPYVMLKSAATWGRQPEMVDTTLGWRFINPLLAEEYPPFSMGQTAENVARQWKIGREEQDEFALRSQQKYQAARAAGKWKEEIEGLEVEVSRKEIRFVEEDEHPRETTLEKLSSLVPAFEKNGTVTAGNSSGINDGAALLLLASEEGLRKSGLKPVAKIRSSAVAGVDPSIMGIGPVPATLKALGRAGLSIDDLGLVELNEAFSSQSIACIRELGINPQKVNVNGGAIAIGHPLGASGARISTTLLHEMKRTGTRYGLATMCIGVGQGAAIIYESL